MTSSARAGQSHLVSMWAQFPIGTRVLVRQWEQPTVTISEPWINTNGIAVVRVSGWGGVEIALERVSLAGPTSVSIADAIQPPPTDGRLWFVDRAAAFNGAAIAFMVTVALVGMLRFLFGGAP